MSKITHGSMGSSHQSTNIPSEPEEKEFVVDNASDALPQEHEGQESVSKEDKRAIEQVLFAGRITKTVDVCGVKFVISTLSHKEHNEITKKIYAFGDAADMFVLRSLFLAQSVKDINGKKIEQVVFNHSGSNDFQAKVDFIDSMQLKVVEKLYKEYKELTDEVDKLFGGETLKK